MASKWPRDLWLDAIWEDETLKPPERVVAYVYARYAGDGDTSWCSYPEVMRRTGMRDRTTISKALQLLTKQGWLTVVDRARQHRSAVYRLTCPLQQSAIPTTGADQQSGIPTPTADSASPAVGIFDASRRDFRLQQSGYWDPSTQIENSEENSEALAPLAREVESSPSGSRPSRTERHPFVVGDWGLCECGLPETNDVHPTTGQTPAVVQRRARRSAKRNPYQNPPAGAYKSWTTAQNGTEGVPA